MRTLYDVLESISFGAHVVLQPSCRQPFAFLVLAGSSSHCFRTNGSKWAHSNTLRPRQNGSHFADEIFRCIFLNQIVWFSIKISLKFVPKGPINNIPALVQITTLHKPGDKPLSEPIMVRLPTHIYVTRHQWVNTAWTKFLAATKQLNEWYFLSVCHTFLTMFPLSNHHEIFRSYH